MIDVLVAGAGPVGLAFAIEAAQAGLTVQVLDPRMSPIDKACGEGLMPQALARLAALGIQPLGADFVGIQYIAPGSSARALFSAGAGRGVRRTVLQEQMIQMARSLGVAFAQERVTHVEHRPGCVQVGEWTARHLIGADGLRSQVRTALGIPVVTNRWHRFGIRQHFELAPWTDVVEVYWLRDAELYVTPIDESTVGIAVLGSAPLDLERAIAAVPSLAARLFGVQRASAARGAGPLRVQPARQRRGNALLIGDAAGYVDALTGEGLRIGFAQAQAALACVLSDDLQGYEAEWQRITRSYRMVTKSLLFAARRERLREAVVPAAHALPFAFRQIVNLL